MNKEKWKDIAIRTFKTFIVAGCMAVVGLGFDDWKTWFITFGSAGLTAVLNLIIKMWGGKENE